MSEQTVTPDIVHSYILQYFSGIGLTKDQSVRARRGYVLLDAWLGSFANVYDQVYHQQRLGPLLFTHLFAVN